jgi:mono/diheme cytochrome c family protein
MRKVLRLVGLLVLGVIVVAAGYLAYVAISGIPKYSPGNVQLTVQSTPEKALRGKKLAGLLCASCHLDRATGKLTGHYQADAPPIFGPIHSKNITQDKEKGIGSWTDGELAYFLRTGIDRTGQYVPPYMIKLPLLADDDMEAILTFLHSDDPWVQAAHVDPPGVTKPSLLTKFLSHTAFGPLPYPSAPIPMPDPADRVAVGRYLSATLGCFACHSADFKTMNELEPEKSPGYMGGGNALSDMNGQEVLSANITPDETAGIGKWSAEDFDRALRAGVRPDGQHLRFPMAMMPELDRDDTAALYAYLRTVPKLAKAVPRAAPPVVAASASEGERVYTQAGCASCHGKTGVGIADLRKAAEHYPDDAQLIAWIKNPESFKPGVKMPAWEGVIPEKDFPPLVAYVKELGARK